MRARVVLIEPSPDGRAQLRATIRGRYCDVVGEADSGPPAIELLSALRGNRAVVVDEPGTTASADAIRDIAAAHPHVEIIGVAHDEERARDLIAAGAHAHFTKDQLDALAEYVARPL
jgi:DNA-binding NarL/FixJ family response regulator